MKPLIHIGYPKAASTLLQHYFSVHPNVYYNGELLNSYKQTGEILLPDFALTDKQTHFVLSEEQLSVWQGNLDIVGVKFRDYDIPAQQVKTAKQLHRQFSNARILIITRGFAGAVQSMYSQYVSIGGILHFADFEKQFGQILSRFYNYNHTINAYRHTFGSENVLVLPFEMLKSNPDVFLNTINQFAELPAIEFDAGVKNASLEQREMESYRRLSSLIYNAVKPLPYNWQQKVYGLYVYALYSRKLGPLASLLGSKQTPVQASASLLNLFKGNATVLYDESFYKPYYKEYLL